MSKEVSAGLAVGAMVLVAGLIWTGFPLDAYSVVAVIFAICGDSSPGSTCART